MGNTIFVTPMSTFTTYLSLGFNHILDLNAFDHLLFLIALTARFQFVHLKSLIILVTAFTVGHSLTLALATLDIISVDAQIIEFLIPLTILLTAVVNIIQGSKTKERIGIAYFFAAVFGLIHGLGFSNYLRALLHADQNLLSPLLSFNLGVELGQIIIVIGILILHHFAFQFLRFKHRDWNLVISSGCAGAAIVLMNQTVFW